MATHHVSPRRACPAPVGQLTPSPGECYLKMNPTQAERTCSKNVSAFTRGNDLPRNPQTLLDLGRCKCPTYPFSHTGEKPAMKRNDVPPAGGPAFIPIAKARGPQPEFSLESDLSGSRSPDTDPRNGTVKLVWYSKYLAKQLMNLGIEPRKSGTENLPLIPLHLARHFWRGMFDGDGCLTTQIKSSAIVPEYRFSLAGSRTVLEAFQQWAQSEAQIRPQKIVVARNSQGATKTCVFYMNGNRQIAALATVLYQESTRRLARKYAIYLALLEQNARTRPSYERIY
jgi:hypothetical protein